MTLPQPASVNRFPLMKQYRKENVAVFSRENVLPLAYTSQADCRVKIANNAPLSTSEVQRNGSLKKAYSVQLLLIYPALLRASKTTPLISTPM